MDRFFKFLNSDRYQYTESEIYLENSMQNQIAVFDVFLRTKNENDYAIVYGIYDVLELIEILNETSYEDRKKYLSELSDNENFIEYMSNMKFTGSIRGVRDGEIVFFNEPILTVTAPLIQGKIMETPILNVLNYQILTATVTSKIIQAAKGREVLFFGTRRVSGFEAAISTGTMTHGFIQSFGMDKDSEYRAFNQFIKTYRNKKYPLIMLIDTYDTMESGIISAIRAFRDNGINDGYEGMYGIRVDSGNLGELSKKCRKILNEKGFYRAKIILTGGLDEKKIKELIENAAEVDIFGVGDAIALPEKEISTVYKMSKIGENNVMKISNEEQKTSLPGSKILYRVYENDDFSDVIMLEKERPEEKNAEKLTIDYIKGGEKIEENCRLLTMEEAKRYYEGNLTYLKKIYSEKEKRNRVNLSENLKNLKENLMKRKKVDI